MPEKSPAIAPGMKFIVRDTIRNTKKNGLTAGKDCFIRHADGAFISLYFTQLGQKDLKVARTLFGANFEADPYSPKMENYVLKEHAQAEYQ